MSPAIVHSLARVGGAVIAATAGALPMNDSAKRHERSSLITFSGYRGVVDCQLSLVRLSDQLLTVKLKLPWEFCPLAIAFQFTAYLPGPSPESGSE